MKYAFSTGLRPDIYESVCFKGGLIRHNWTLQFIPVWMTLTITQDHRVMRKLELVLSFCCKLVWTNPNICHGWLCKGRCVQGSPVSMGNKDHLSILSSCYTFQSWDWFIDYCRVFFTSCMHKICHHFSWRNSDQLLPFQFATSCSSLCGAVCTSCKSDTASRGGWQAATGSWFCPDGDGHLPVLSACGWPRLSVSYPACLQVSYWVLWCAVLGEDAQWEREGGPCLMW